MGSEQSTDRPLDRLGCRHGRRHEANGLFIGAPETADKQCGEDYTAEAVESDTAVVVIVIRHTNTFAGACSAVGARRTATVDLAKPLGERAVLEVMEGRSVPVLLGP